MILAANQGSTFLYTSYNLRSGFKLGQWRQGNDFEVLMDLRYSILVLILISHPQPHKLSSPIDFLSVTASWVPVLHTYLQTMEIYKCKIICQGQILFGTDRSLLMYSVYFRHNYHLPRKTESSVKQYNRSPINNFRSTNPTAQI